MDSLRKLVVSCICFGEFMSLVSCMKRMTHSNAIKYAINAVKSRGR